MVASKDLWVLRTRKLRTLEVAVPQLPVVMRGCQCLYQRCCQRNNGRGCLHFCETANIISEVLTLSHTSCGILEFVKQTVETHVFNVIILKELSWEFFVL